MDIFRRFRKKPKPPEPSAKPPRREGREDTFKIDGFIVSLTQGHGGDTGVFIDIEKATATEAHGIFNKIEAGLKSVRYQMSGYPDNNQRLYISEAMNMSGTAADQKPPLTYQDAHDACAKLGKPFIAAGGVEIKVAEHPGNNITITTEGDKPDSQTVLGLISKALRQRGYEFSGEFLDSNHFVISIRNERALPSQSVVLEVIKDLGDQYPDAASLKKYNDSEERRMKEAMKRVEKYKQ